MNDTTDRPFRETGSGSGTSEASLVPGQRVLGKKLSGQVQSLERALKLLQCLAAVPEGLSLTVAAQRVELAVSTAHRLLRTLEDHEFVRQNRGGGVWQIGPRAFIVGSAFVVGRDLFTFTRPFLFHIRDASQESSALLVPEHLSAVAVQVAPSQQALRAEPALGQRTLMHVSAAGQAMLSVRADLEISDYFNELANRGGETIALAQRLQIERDIAQIREQEAAITENDPADGILTIASAITDNRRRAVAAIQLTAPMSRTETDQRTHYTQLVREAAQRLTYMYAGRARQL